MTEYPFRATSGDGAEIHPGEGSVPILHEVGYKRLALIGTGFWISRYGLFLTAGHVADVLMKADGELDVAFVLHWGREAVHLRAIRRITRWHAVDLAIAQADNYLERYPKAPLMNRRAPLTTTVPPIGSKVATFAYPENAVLDFTGPEPPAIRGDYFEGVMLKNVTGSEHPFIQYPHLETSIELRSGASGGPVFDEGGRVVGINCRGWDFRGAEHQEDHLSSVVPIGAIMPMEVPLLQLPPSSWEEIQVPAARKNRQLTVAELCAYGHIDFVR